MQISKILRLLLQYVKYTSGHVCSLRFFVDYVFRLTLSLADGAPRLIFVEENIQEYFKVSLRPLSCVHVQVVCMCVSWYGNIWVELSIILLKHSHNEISIWLVTKCCKVWSRFKPCSVADGSHPRIEFWDPQITYALLYSSIIISYILNVRMLGLNSQIFNICWL